MSDRSSDVADLRDAITDLVLKLALRERALLSSTDMDEYRQTVRDAHQATAHAWSRFHHVLGDEGSWTTWAS